MKQWKILPELEISEPQNFQIYGIASWGLNCNATEPAKIIYVRLSYHYHWLKKFTDRIQDSPSRVGLKQRCLFAPLVFIITIIRIKSFLLRTHFWSFFILDCDSKNSKLKIWLVNNSIFRYCTIFLKKCQKISEIYKENNKE